MNWKRSNWRSSNVAGGKYRNIALGAAFNAAAAGELVNMAHVLGKTARAEYAKLGQNAVERRRRCVAGWKSEG